MNNLTDFAICGIVFWAFGMGFAFNGTSGGFGGWDFVSQETTLLIWAAKFLVWAGF